MRPEILYPLFQGIQNLEGLGPRYAGLVGKLAGPLVVDLVYHLPLSWQDRRARPKVAEIQHEQLATVTGTVLSHHPSAPRSRQPYKVMLEDETGCLTLVFFRAKKPYLEKLLPIGATRVVSGKFQLYDSYPQITHPDVYEEGRVADIARLEANYPSTAGLPAKVLQKSIRQALRRTPDLPEWLDKTHKTQQGWPDWKAALTALHLPEDLQQVGVKSPARLRLAYDELLADQLALTLMRNHERRQNGTAFPAQRTLTAKAYKLIPYKLTGAQEKALQEIGTNMAEPERMLRLLQGDVGSGKTVVAFLALLRAIENGHQGALMAPTEILAQQHLATLAPLCKELGVTIDILTGRDGTALRREKLERLQSGDIQLIIGTHALFQESVNFHKLGLVVVDEQHRFGVHQRLMLQGKGSRPDLLVMTATPIPRTLCLTAFGHMDVSRLDEKPPGRQPVQTQLIPLTRMAEVVESLKRALEKGAKIYWVCPLVEESEKSDLAAAEDRHQHLQKHFGAQVGLIHGRQSGEEKDAAMDTFINGNVNILVATTVIEVGVNVPAATVMVIEHAERFGLSQLHQLRGRVGRGEQAGVCLLLYKHPLGQTARARLKIMRESNDGFRIAEEDWKLRGSGEMLGTRQSGVPVYKVADLEVDKDLLHTARDDARLFLQQDPDLTSARGQALRTLLYLLRKEDGIKYLQSG